MRTNLKPFCKIPLVDLPEQSTFNDFGQCLSLSEFLNTFKEFLNYEKNFSVCKLLKKFFRFFDYFLKNQKYFCTFLNFLRIYIYFYYTIKLIFR